MHAVAPNFSRPGGGAGKPQACRRRLRGSCARAPAPKPAPVWGLSVRPFPAVFPPVPAPSWRHGSACTGSGDCPGPRTFPSPPGGGGCGLPRWPGCGRPAWHTPGTRARPGAGRAAGRLPRRAGGTSCDTPPSSGGAPLWACGSGSTPHGSGRSTPDAGRAGAAFWLRAITSGQKKKPEPTLTPRWGLVGLWLSLWAITSRDAKSTCTDKTAQRGSCGTGTLAQALVDIYDMFPAATFAVDLQAFGPGLRVNPKDPLLSTGRTHQPSVPHDKFTRFLDGRQLLFLPFSKTCLRFH